MSSWSIFFLFFSCTDFTTPVPFAVLNLNTTIINLETQSNSHESTNYREEAMLVHG